MKTTVTLDTDLANHLEAYFFGWLSTAFPPGTFTSSTALATTAEKVTQGLMREVVRPALQRHNVASGGGR
ncbi:hypothetical protein M8C13_36210 [Crossiella sp. SN42]|uniref:hypothetical protein n=1 Tax=Crossiella sp. SN42 TaxID=2944808 RepID=UPI00207D52D8|nr:hypothetical protein [Crossiella sp. SN42]MCO1581208.1 hypothetical protein [Crossiella sp. SN42]